MSDSPNIPFCQSEFLQDFTISLGLHLEPATHGWLSCSAEVDICEHEGERWERLTIWIATHYSTRVNLTLWEDKTVWVSVALVPTENNDKFELGFYPNFEFLSFDEIVEALVGTVSVSTRLCYRESPMPTLRRIWKHTGDVKTVGVLAAAPKAR